jgi:hypothetical protein
MTRSNMIIEGTVTDRRKFSSKMSASRNADWFWGLTYNERIAIDADAFKADPTVCHHCRNRFAVGQMRYPIMTMIDGLSGWALASVCMSCFKVADEDETGTQQRHQSKCRGCDAPILTPSLGPHHRFEVCGNRCYQRAYRKRRRGLASVVDWKMQRPVCEACKQAIKPSRRDARFCSNKCRQWHYRRRRATP